MPHLDAVSSHPTPVNGKVYKVPEMGRYRPVIITWDGGGALKQGPRICVGDKNGHLDGSRLGWKRVTGNSSSLFF